MDANRFAFSRDVVLLTVALLTVAQVRHTDGLPEGSFSVSKRMNIETCLVRFDVHLNTIIRTEESRSMGAKFLDDADLSSREQCLRLCCETEKCDVFVFEEKSPGTCFLFQCGPPENFRCKFTHHSNYTSAVLSIPPPPLEQLPPPAPLAAQIQSLSQPVSKLSQHEMELVSLRGKPTRSELTTTSTIIPPLGVRLGDLTTSTVKPVTPPQCGHFEFPCHSGECIAVYNVCDGIPQCEDGSDEGTECPQKSSPSVQSIQGGPINHQAMENAVNQPSLMAASRGAVQKQMLPAHLYQLDYQQPPPLRGTFPEQQIQKPIIHHNREDPMTAPKPWPRPMNEANYLDPSENRIFNHKAGIQLTANNLAQPQYQEPLPDNGYLPSMSRNGGYMAVPGGYQQQDLYKPVQQWPSDARLSPPIRQNWPPVPLRPQEQYLQPPAQQRPPLELNQPPPSSAIDRPPQMLPPNSPGQWSSGQGAAAVANNASNSLRPKATAGGQGEIKAASTGGKHKNAKSSDEYEEAYDDTYPESPGDTEEDHTETPKKKQHKHKKHDHDDSPSKDQGEPKKKKTKTIKKDKAAVHDAGSSHPVHEHLKMLRNDIELEFADHDGHSDRPGGAVLSLTLGVILTAAMAILISCRMRVARRRIRRPGKSSYAHDADFLVNGMYL